MQQHLFVHFSEEAHHSFLEDVSFTLIDKFDPSNPLQRENYWRSTLKTMTPWWLKVEDFVWNSISRYSYDWICTDCTKDLIYGKRFWYRLLLFVILSSLSLLLPFLVLHCFYYYYLCDDISILIIIIINFGATTTPITIIFMTLLLLWHHCFVPFNTYYISSLFSIFSLLLLLLYHYSITIITWTLL